MMGRQEEGLVSGVSLFAKCIQFTILMCAAAALQAHPPTPSQGPLNPPVVTLDAGDVLTDALVREGLPRHELEAETKRRSLQSVHLRGWRL
jgi:hypothetical protein